MRRRRPLMPLACLAAVGALAPLLGAAPADAQQSTIPDMLGTWKVETPVVVTGAGAHHPVNAPPPVEEGGSTWRPRLRTFVGTLRVAGQEDGRFWGTLESPYYREDVVGVFTSEGGRFLMEDSDGSHEGEVTGPGRIRYCYRQNEPDLRVVGCGTMTKEP